jgi:hypothetical protein
MLGSIAVSLTLLAAPPAAPAHHWRAWRHLTGVVDLAGPRSDGAIVASARGRLWLIDPRGRLRPFARGAHGYQTNASTEPYLDVAPTPPVAACRWRRDDLAVLRVGPSPAVLLVHPSGQVALLASLPPGVPDGITFDRVGRFSHRLLVTVIVTGGATSVFAIGCDGHRRRLVSGAPHMEGGIAMAPLGFGRYGGDLVAADELAGVIYAVTPTGAVAVLARSRFAHGSDIGVESLGFVPAHAAAVLVADRGTPGNRHPGRTRS